MTEETLSWVIRIRGCGAKTKGAMEGKSAEGEGRGPPDAWPWREDAPNSTTPSSDTIG